MLVNRLKLKVCGMREDQNLLDLAQIPPDYMGLIFHQSSARFVGDQPPKALQHLPSTIKKTGVFVKEEALGILQKVKTFGLKAVQLHGDQSPLFLASLRTAVGAKVEIIKVFRIGEAFDFSETEAFEGLADYFLFDTKGKDYGGNGFTFNWQLLKEYKGNVPFFLSGGIGPKQMEEVKNFRHPQLYGLDLNSKFEQQPGLKDIQQIVDFWNNF